jgi:hypothetical protein
MQRVLSHYRTTILMAVSLLSTSRSALRQPWSRLVPSYHVPVPRMVLQFISMVGNSKSSSHRSKTGMRQ